MDVVSRQQHTTEEARSSTPEAASPSLAVEIAGIRLAHPVLAAPGPLGFGREVQNVVNLGSFAAFITKSVTLHPRSGNPYPQIVPTDSGWLNSLGLPNRGLAGFLTKDLPFLRTLGIPLIVSIAGETVDEFITLAEWLGREDDVTALELNVSCPNVDSGLIFGVDPHLTRDLVAAVRAVCTRPVWVKLTPNVTDIVSIARAAQDAGADALALINTLVGLAIDVQTRTPKLGAGVGGLSGPAIRPVAVRMVWEVARHCRIPVIGMGGIVSADDALEFLIAGARAIAVGSAVIDRPGVATEIRDGLARYLQGQNMHAITELVGSLATDDRLPATGSRDGAAGGSGEES